MPSGRNATWLGPEFLLPRSSLPAAVSVLPLMVKIDTEPSLRLAVSASVPDGLIDTPVTPGPACRVCVTAGGLALRSMTEMRSSGAVFFGSAGSTFMAEVTIAKLSSFETATLCGTPTTLLGACSFAQHLRRRYADVENGHRIRRRIGRHGVLRRRPARSCCHWRRPRSAQSRPKRTAAGQALTQARYPA